MGLRKHEQRLVEIRRRATLLAVALVSEPFSMATAQQLRAYTDNDADDAQDLAQKLREMPEEALRARITELTSRTSGGNAVGLGITETAHGHLDEQ